MPLCISISTRLVPRSAPAPVPDRLVSCTLSLGLAYPLSARLSLQLPLFPSDCFPLVSQSLLSCSLSRVRIRNRKRPRHRRRYSRLHRSSTSFVQLLFFHSTQKQQPHSRIAPNHQTTTNIEYTRQGNEQTRPQDITPWHRFFHYTRTIFGTASASHQTKR